MQNIVWLFIVNSFTLWGGETFENSPEIDAFWIWIALFTLALIGVLILYFSSRQTMKIQKFHQEMLKKQLEMEKNQNLLLTNMSETIHNIAKQALEKNMELSKHASSENNNTLENIEDRLLTVTNDLIDFLRLKSQKVEIINEKFNINNVLNEVSGSICSRFSGKKTEFIFDIDHATPRYMIGDSLHLGQIIESVLDYMMEYFSGDEVKLEITVLSDISDKLELQFRFTDTSDGMSQKRLDELFTPYYNEEKGIYVGLGIFVAHELVSMMNGNLSVSSKTGQGNTFILNLPFEVEQIESKDGYALAEKIIKPKKVFIVDENYNAALAIKKTFTYFNHEVKVMTKSDFLHNLPNLTPYDIVVLHESLFSTRLVEYLSKIKIAKELKVIALNALMHSDKKSFVDNVIDVHLFKPLNQERIMELIIDIYNLKVPTAFNKAEGKDNTHAKIHHRHIVTTKNITQKHFKDFKDKNILIVEDDLINQKVLINLFNHSGIHISIANQGQEAVDLIKRSNVKFDLVLMDINMPIMDGYTATQMIRLDSKYDALPVVAFTALVLESEIRKMFNSGINAFLAKPLNIGKLYTALSMYLLDTPTLDIKEITETNYERYDGLDIEKGIMNANNNEALYIEVIHEFDAAYGESAEVFKQLVHEFRYEQIKMMCIDLRGLTGTIGAFDMHELILDIHRCLLYNKKELLPNYIGKYSFEMGVLSKSIQKVIES